MIPITTHAVRRYIESVVRFPCYARSDWKAIATFEIRTGRTEHEIEDLIRADVTERIPATVLSNGTRKVIKGECARYVVQDGCVVTCWEISEAAE